ncbi:hypothetical protein NDU88_004840 [Pleurodeles waltl]|uniref:Uncharacterized protein n=1 Tax=Pleurodeles waltl TaxID=8319 RepID=A0AAV7M895_PLEWA|nr:hypothetical protein NDU88_004840 [Pleurodeles waltl]
MVYGLVGGPSSEGAVGLLRGAFWERLDRLSPEVTARRRGHNGVPWLRVLRSQVTDFNCPRCAAAFSTLVTVEEQSQAKLLEAIQGSRVAFEGKIETVAVEVNFLQADLQKVSDEVKVAEGSILDLQTEVGALRKQMVLVNSTVRRL